MLIKHAALLAAQHYKAESAQGLYPVRIGRGDVKASVALHLVVKGHV